MKALTLKSEPAPSDDVLDIVEHDGEPRYLSVTVGDAETYMTAHVNGHAYPDLLYPRAVEEFIDCTYEAYADRVSDHFGETIPSIFTDEPHVYTEPFGMPDGMLGYVPWTVGLPTIFREAYGYDLLAHLPSLFYDEDTGGRSFKAVRYDFWQLITRECAESTRRRFMTGVRTTGSN